MKRYIIAIDEGTTSARCVLYDTLENTIKDSVQRKFKQHYPANGWVEHDAQQIFSVVKKNLYEIIERNHLTIADIISIGITNQRETVVAWDKRTGKPIYNAIVWQCRRTANFCKTMDKKTKLYIKNKTGLILDSYFSATKMRWILLNVGGARKLAREGNLCFGTIDAFLVFKLTRGKTFATDTSNASRTLLLSLDKPLEWDDELLKIFRIPKNSLPEIKNSADNYGEAVTKFGRIPIYSVIGDQMASLFGQGCFETNDAKNTYGTGAFLLVNTGNRFIRENKKLISSVAWTIEGRTTYTIEGSVFNVGSSLNFLHEKLNLFDDFAKISDICFDAKSNNGVYFLPAFTGLGAPHWRPSERGRISGLTLSSSKEHIIRACLESFAYSISDIMEYLRAINVNICCLSVDGGVSKTDFLLQFQSDILGIPITRVKNSESTSLGTIFLSGLFAGVFKNLAQLSKKIESDQTFTPTMSALERKKNLQGWKKSLKNL